MTGTVTIATLRQFRPTRTREVRFKRSFVNSFVVSVLRHYGLRLPVLPVSACELQALASEGTRAPSYHYCSLCQLAWRTRHAELRMSSQRVTAPASTRPCHSQANRFVLGLLESTDLSPTPR